MKSQRIIYLLFLFFPYMINAQTPLSIPYQAVARDASGEVISIQLISLRFTIRDIAPNGSIVYRETQNQTTNQFGLFNANIGAGTLVIGNFTNIDWAEGAKYLQVEMDINGGSSYIDMGTQQMLSVPYSLYSENSANSWNLKGNLNTDPSLNFIGTQDDKPLIFKSNNIKSGLLSTKNICFGKLAGNNLSIGEENILIGSEAGLTLTTGFNNIFIGPNAGHNFQTSGSSNIFIGAGAGYESTTCFDNNFIGHTAGYHITTGTSNNFFGESAGFRTNIGTKNSFFGHQAGYNNNSGNSNTFSGYFSGRGNTQGIQNSFLGFNAGLNNTTGNNNSFFGTNAGLSNTNESLNTFIGYQSNGASGISNSTAIGANAQATISNAVVLGNNANVGIGTTAPSEKLDIVGKIKQNVIFGGAAAHSIIIPSGIPIGIEINHSGTGGGLIQGSINNNSNNSTAAMFQSSGLGRTLEIDQFNSSNVQSLVYLSNSGSGKYIDAAGNAYLSSGGNTWVNSSEKIKKSEITLVNGRDILDKISLLPIYSWHYKNESPADKHIGPMAEDFYNIFKVGYDSLSISTIDPSGVALAAIRELINQNNDLRHMIAILSTKLEAINSIMGKKEFEDNTVGK